MIRTFRASEVMQITRHLSPLAAMLLGITLLIDSSPCTARAYRCTDANNNISYSQTPCPAGHKSATMHGVGKTRMVDREACTSVRKFAGKSFGKLSGGTEPSLLIDKYGGPSYIDHLTLNVINFVSGFRLSGNITAMKVGTMAFNKCLNGGFGKLQAKTLPVEMLPPEETTPKPPQAQPSPPTGQPLSPDPAPVSHQ